MVLLIMDNSKKRSNPDIKITGRNSWGKSAITFTRDFKFTGIATEKGQLVTAFTLVTRTHTDTTSSEFSGVRGKDETDHEVIIVPQDKVSYKELMNNPSVPAQSTKIARIKPLKIAKEVIIALLELRRAKSYFRRHADKLSLLPQTSSLVSERDNVRSQGFKKTKSLINFPANPIYRKRHGKEL